MATIGSGIHYSNAVTKKFQSGSEDIIDIIGANTESQETLNHKSINPDKDIQQPAVTIYKNKSNFMSNNHAANLTGGETNSTLKSQEKATKAGPTIFPSLDIYKVTVTFNSIHVFDNHEGLFSGDGEFNLAAYVQGIKVDLTDASEPRNCAGLGCNGGPQLLDVSSGQTVLFKPGTQVSVYLPGTVPLSIFTAGVEVDGCGLKKFPEGDRFAVGPEFPGLTLADIFKNPQLDWASAVAAFINNALIFQHCSGISDDNDNLGRIVDFYRPPGWGAGTHLSFPLHPQLPDYDLNYTITVKQMLPAKQIESSK